MVERVQNLNRFSVIESVVHYREKYRSMFVRSDKVNAMGQRVIF